MIGRFFKAMRLSRMCHKSGKLFIQERYAESLDVLYQIEKINGPEWLTAGYVVIKGNTLVKMGQYSEGVAQYDDFLQNRLQDIKLEQDREYLHAYAVFLRDHAARRLDSSHPITISKQRVLELRKRASLVTREDFTLSK